MRIICMGTGGFIVPTFRALCDSRHDVVAVVTRPEKPGVGKKAPPPAPMRVAAAETTVPLHAPVSINDPSTLDLLRGYAADLFVVCDYGQILSAETLGIARLGGVNLHGSLLPAYRGAAPVQWAVYDGCSETGVSTIHMTPRLDAGPVLTKRSTPILAKETAGELEERLAELGVDAVIEAIDMLQNWNGQETLGELQDTALATKAPRLKKSDGLANWTRTARQLVDQVRAFQPWPQTYTFWQPKNKVPIRLVLHEVSTAGTASEAAPGTVLKTSPAWLIATGTGVLRIDRVQPAGKKAMAAADFLRGHAVAPGDRLGQPSP